MFCIPDTISETIERSRVTSMSPFLSKFHSELENIKFLYSHDTFKLISDKPFKYCLSDV